MIELNLKAKPSMVAPPPANPVPIADNWIDYGKYTTRSGYDAEITQIVGSYAYGQVKMIAITKQFCWHRKTGEFVDMGGNPLGPFYVPAPGVDLNFFQLAGIKREDGTIYPTFPYLLKRWKEGRPLRYCTKTSNTIVAMAAYTHFVNPTEVLKAYYTNDHFLFKFPV